MASALSAPHRDTLLAYLRSLGQEPVDAADAYARALKYAETDNNPGKDAWKQRFTEVYKHKNKSDAGMNEYLNSILDKPLPDPNTI